tara:strand:- start:406 stop:1428 length:1023 start_codon:yes stop_codon:yes gene_type:complete
MHTVIHIGNHKTGTKLLQRNFFPKMKSIRFLGSPFEFKSELHELFERIKYQDILTYNTKRTSDIYKKLKASGKLGSENDPVLISDEALVTPFFGGKMTAEPAIIAKRIKDLFGNIKIIYVIRSQFSLLPSIYTQFVPPEWINQTHFEERIYENLKNHLNGMMHGIKFEKICSLYENLFGKENMKVIPYEMLINDPESYLKEICEFIGEPLDKNLINGIKLIKENKRRSRGHILWEILSAKYERARKKYQFGHPSKYIPFLSSNKVKFLLDNFLLKKPIELKISNELKTVIEKFYGPSNNRLQKVYNLDLAKYNYPLDDSIVEKEDDVSEIEFKGWSIRRF